MNNPLVSILIPFKNTAKFLHECIQSITNQTYSNWELIIVDDNSTDKSFSIVENYAITDGRIKLLKNEGNGIIDALRLALNESKGEFITRMDSDDIMFPSKLEVLSTNLIKYGKNHLAVGNVKYFSENGIGDGYAKYELWLNRLTQTGSNFSEIYKECVIPSPCWMAFKDDLLACDGFNPNRYPEDYDLAFRFYKNNLKCIPCEKILHYWRDYEIRTSRTHEHYAENHFIALKLNYFLELNYIKEKSLTIWGAGNKGKVLAKALIKKGIPFHWICDNPNKIGRDIYGQELKPFQFLEGIQNPQSIITVANVNSQSQIKTYLKKQNLKPMKDYFFFC
jgi:glycosyltransferase involved in cell wall biosynthesis